jgi:hypothetical protein
MGLLREETASDATSEKEKVAFYGVLKLRNSFKIVKDATEHEATLNRQREELRTSLTETRFEGERAIRWIKELENKVQEKTGEANLH